MLYDQAESIFCLHVSVVYCANTIDVSFGNCGYVLNTSNGLCGATVSVTDHCIHSQCPSMRGIRSAASGSSILKSCQRLLNVTANSSFYAHVLSINPMSNVTIRPITEHLTAAD